MSNYIALVELVPLEAGKGVHTNVVMIDGVPYKSHLYAYISPRKADALKRILSEAGCKTNKDITLFNCESFCKIYPRLAYPNRIVDFWIDRKYLGFSEKFFEYRRNKDYDNQEAHVPYLMELLTSLFDAFGIDLPFTESELCILLKEIHTEARNEKNKGVKNALTPFIRKLRRCMDDEEILEKTMLKVMKDKYKENYAIIWEG